MSAEPQTDPTVENLEQALVQVGTYPTYQAGSEHGLVVLAMGLPYWLMPVDAGFALWVESPPSAEVRRQLARFDRESLRWPPRPLELRSYRGDIVGALLWALLLMLVFRGQTEWDLVRRGALDAHAMFAQGELWRAFTALFLHADTGHLVSNLVSGVFVLWAVTSVFGRGAGWLLVSFAGVLGNIATAAAHYPEAYVSLGASTALFAGLGLLTGRAASLALRTSTQRLRNILLPLGAGVCMLALYGAGGREVDLGAHLCGFAMGAALGAAAAFLAQSRRR